MSRPSLTILLLPVIALAAAPCVAAGTEPKSPLDELPSAEPEAPHLALAPAIIRIELEQPKDEQPQKTEEAPPTPAKLEQGRAQLRFGDPGYQYVALGAGLADNGEDVDENIFASYSYFIAKDVEFFGEVGAWQYSQVGKDATGFNLSMVLRWHFFDRGKWTMFMDLGIGVLAATDPVPRRGGTEGTQFNFTPRAGGGFTRELTDDGVRLEVGLRWAHVSNARLSGNNENPGRDSLMLYTGIIFPF
jgi:hypothetical protein